MLSGAVLRREAGETRRSGKHVSSLKASDLEWRTRRSGTPTPNSGSRVWLAPTYFTSSVSLLSPRSVRCSSVARFQIHVDGQLKRRLHVYGAREERAARRRIAERETHAGSEAGRPANGRGRETRGSAERAGAGWTGAARGVAPGVEVAECGFRERAGARRADGGKVSDGRATCRQRRNAEAKCRDLSPSLSSESGPFRNAAATPS